MLCFSIHYKNVDRGLYISGEDNGDMTLLTSRLFFPTLFRFLSFIKVFDVWLQFGCLQSGKQVVLAPKTEDYQATSPCFDPSLSVSEKKRLVCKAEKHLLPSTWFTLCPPQKLIGGVFRVQCLSWGFFVAVIPEAISPKELY